MAQAPAAKAQQLVQELKVSAHLMTLEPGVFCIFHAAGQKVDQETGLPGVRVTVPPEHGSGDAAGRVSILSFDDGGWIGGADNAALIRVTGEVAQVLITIYQRMGASEAAPKIQIQQLSESRNPTLSKVAAAQRVTEPSAHPSEVENAEVSAHVQRRGDVVAKLGDWMGERGSQRWIEGYALSPRGELGKGDIEYQAVLGRGWLSPWSEGGQYCGSRGMALPILGLRVRLRGEAAQRNTLKVRATFTDGSSAGPVDGTKTCEAESLAPLEAFQVEILPIGGAARPPAATAEPAVQAVPNRLSQKTKPQVAAAKAPAAAGRARSPAKAPVKAPVKARAQPMTKAKPVDGRKR